ncbi:MAG: hypothetical protein JRG73_04395 [Deltaproteobacteria bacterium]|nr:hypothetical protein [Deltaproteobacteria bacterium]
MATTFGPGFHGNDNLDLAASAAAAFPGLFLAANIGVIKIEHLLEALARISVLHGFANLMTPYPGRLIKDAQIILELTSRTSCASDGHKKYSPKPVSQRLSCSVKNSMATNRSLMPACSALVQFTRFNQIGPLTAQQGQRKPSGHLRLKEISQTVSFCAKPSSELFDGHFGIHFFIAVV